MRPLILCSALAVLFSPLAQAQSSVTKATAAKAAKTTKAKRPVKAAEPAEPAELDAERMAVVPQVLVGEIACEFGRTVRVEAHPELSGRFVLTIGKQRNTMTPQPTTTGVVRLEDARSGLTWLQVPVKSMLMDTRKGQRVADNCLHAAQSAELAAQNAAAAESNTSTAVSQ